MSIPTNSNTTSYKERIAVVTGSSSGFGLLTAITLAQKHYRVIATMRNLEGAAELLAHAERAGVTKQIELACVDVTDHTSIEEVVTKTLQNYGRIDVLVNNAGFAIGGFVEDVDMNSWRKQMETNFFGLVAMTQRVIPAMRKQQSGMIINMSSISGRVGFPGYAPYASSKFAVEGFSESLRHELSPFGIQVVLLEPGAYRTPIWDKGLAGMISSDTSPYKLRLKSIVEYSRKSGETAPDPQQVADFIGRLVDKRSTKLRYLLGQGLVVAVLGKAFLPWRWFERMVERGTRG